MGKIYKIVRDDTRDVSSLELTLKEAGAKGERILRVPARELFLQVNGGSLEVVGEAQEDWPL